MIVPPLLSIQILVNGFSGALTIIAGTLFPGINPVEVPFVVQVVHDDIAFRTHRTYSTTSRATS